MASPLIPFKRSEVALIRKLLEYQQWGELGTGTDFRKAPPKPDDFDKLERDKLLQTINEALDG